MVEPAHEDFSVAQFLQPRFGGKLRGFCKDEICLARQRLKPQPGQFVRQMSAGGDDAFEIRAVIRQVAQRGKGGDLAEAVDVVAVANFVQGGDEIRLPDAVADALLAQRVGLGKGARDQDIWELEG